MTEEERNNISDYIMDKCNYSPSYVMRVHSGMNITYTSITEFIIAIILTAILF